MSEKISISHWGMHDIWERALPPIVNPLEKKVASEEIFEPPECLAHLFDKKTGLPF